MTPAALNEAQRLARESGTPHIHASRMAPRASQWPLAHFVILPGPSPAGEVDLTLGPHLLATRGGSREIRRPRIAPRMLCPRALRGPSVPAAVGQKGYTDIAARTRCRGDVIEGEVDRERSEDCAEPCGCTFPVRNHPDPVVD